MRFLGLLSPRLVATGVSDRCILSIVAAVRAPLLFEFSRPLRLRLVLLGANLGSWIVRIVRAALLGLGHRRAEQQNSAAVRCPGLTFAVSDRCQTDAATVTQGRLLEADHLPRRQPCSNKHPSTRHGSYRIKSVGRPYVVSNFMRLGRLADRSEPPQSSHFLRHKLAVSRSSRPADRW